MKRSEAILVMVVGALALVGMCMVLAGLVTPPAPQACSNTNHYMKSCE